jgi:hypothetical protein
LNIFIQPDLKMVARHIQNCGPDWEQIIVIFFLNQVCKITEGRQSAFGEIQNQFIDIDIYMYMYIHTYTHIHRIKILILLQRMHSYP